MVFLVPKYFLHIIFYKKEKDALSQCVLFVSSSKLQDEEQKKRGVFQVHGIYPMPVIMKTNVNKQNQNKEVYEKSLFLFCNSIIQLHHQKARLFYMKCQHQI